jgi:hypothetical protein
MNDSNDRQAFILNDLIDYFQDCQLEYENKAKEPIEQQSKDFYQGVAFGYQCASQSIKNQIEVLFENK